MKKYLILWLGLCLVFTATEYTQADISSNEFEIRKEKSIQLLVANYTKPHKKLVDKCVVVYSLALPDHRLSINKKSCREAAYYVLMAEPMANFYYDNEANKTNEADFFDADEVNITISTNSIDFLQVKLGCLFRAAEKTRDRAPKYNNIAYFSDYWAAPMLPELLPAYLGTNLRHYRTCRTAFENEVITLLPHADYHFAEERPYEEIILTPEEIAEILRTLFPDEEVNATAPDDEVNISLEQTNQTLPASNRTLVETNSTFTNSTQ